MKYNSNNIFAKILRKEIPANVIYENDYCLAFHDIAPKAAIHLLVIPKGPYIDLNDFLLNAPQETQYNYFQGIKDCLEQFDLTENGFRIISNSGEHGCQEVPHFHMHILGGEKLPATSLSI